MRGLRELGTLKKNEKKFEKGKGNKGTGKNVIRGVFYLFKLFLRYEQPGRLRQWIASDK